MGYGLPRSHCRLGHLLRGHQKPTTSAEQCLAPGPPGSLPPRTTGVQPVTVHHGLRPRDPGSWVLRWGSGSFVTPIPASPNSHQPPTKGLLNEFNKRKVFRCKGRRQLLMNGDDHPLLPSFRAPVHIYRGGPSRGRPSPVTAQLTACPLMTVGRAHGAQPSCWCTPALSLSTCSDAAFLGDSKRHLGFLTKSCGHSMALARRPTEDAPAAEAHPGTRARS